MQIDGIQITDSPDAAFAPVTYADMSLDRADMSQSYIIQSVTGLGVEDVFGLFSGQLDAGFDLLTMTMKDRIVVLTIKLNPQLGAGETLSSLRDRLYKAIWATPMAEVRLRLMKSGVAVAYLDGKIRKMDPSLFSSDSFIQITFECDYPLLQSVDAGVVGVGSDVIGADITLIDDKSTAPHGLELRLRATGGVAAPFTINTIRNGVTLPFKINLPGALATGDRIWINSRHGERFVWWWPNLDPSPENVIDWIDTEQNYWPIMYPGSTRFTMSSINMGIQSGTSPAFKYTYWGI